MPLRKKEANADSRVLPSDFRGFTTLAVAEPLLRWVGGKRQLVSRLEQRVRPYLGRLRYVEPFVGAGSLFFRLRPEKALISDANQHLIRFYESVRDEMEEVARHTEVLRRTHSKAQYYRVRHSYNTSPWSATQAARFLYLNRTCFNGVFRVNTEGAFNVPCGDKRCPKFPSFNDLAAVAAVLEDTDIRAMDYRECLKEVGKGDFVYLDPPYPPLNGTAYFTHYTMDRFGSDNQVQLAHEVRRLHNKGARVLMTNADTPVIRRLYEGFRYECVPVTRYVSSGKEKHRVSEIVITNY